MSGKGFLLPHNMRKAKLSTLVWILANHECYYGNPSLITSLNPNNLPKTPPLTNHVNTTNPWLSWLNFQQGNFRWPTQTQMPFLHVPDLYLSNGELQAASRPFSNGSLLLSGSYGGKNYLQNILLLHLSFLKQTKRCKSPLRVAD